MKEYFIKHIANGRYPKYITSATREVFSTHDNFLIYRFHPNESSPKMISIENIDADGDGRGTVLVARVAKKAIDVGVNHLTGMFQPRKDRERTKLWYIHRGFEVTKENELFANSQNAYDLCMQILSVYSTIFTDLT